MENKISKSEVFKKAWSSFRYFLNAGMKVTFAGMLKRAWAFIKAAANPRPLDLSDYTKRS